MEVPGTYNRMLGGNTANPEVHTGKTYKNSTSLERKIKCGGVLWEWSLNGTMEIKNDI